MAKLIFRHGAMNSGKSIQVLTVAHNYEERGMNVLIFKPSIDTKADDRISSRIGLERKVDYLIKEDDSILRLIKEGIINSKKISCIIVDECQFLTPAQVNEFRYISDKDNIPVICYGLRTDFRTNLFPGSKRLFELSDLIEEIPTICDCGKKAKFNARVIDGKFTTSGRQVAIDGKNNVTYTSLCTKCYFNKVAKISYRNLKVSDTIIKKVTELGKKAQK